MGREKQFSPLRFNKLSYLVTSLRLSDNSSMLSLADAKASLKCLKTHNFRVPNSTCKLKCFLHANFPLKINESF